MLKLINDIKIKTKSANFGSSVALSENNEWLAASAPNEDKKKGRIYIYKRNKLGDWDLFQTIESVTRLLGHGLSLNKTGEVLVASDLTINNGEVVTSSVFIYKLIKDKFVKIKTIKPELIDENRNYILRASISPDSTTIAVGVVPTDYFGECVTGYVNIYKATEHSWKLDQVVKLDGSEGYYGSSVSLNNDGSILVVGAPDDSTDIDAKNRVYIYELDEDNVYKFKAIVKPDKSIPDSGYGISISISSNGNYLIIGSPFKNTESNEDVGEVYLYRLNDSDVYELIDNIINDNGSKSEIYFGLDASIIDTGELIIGQGNGDGEVFEYKLID